jgi:ribonuclease Z
VRKLLLTHFSARYSRDAIDLLREAQPVFAQTVIGKDGMEVEVPFRDASDGG